MRLATGDTNLRGCGQNRAFFDLSRTMRAVHDNCCTATTVVPPPPWFQLLRPPRQSIRPVEKFERARVPGFEGKVFRSPLPGSAPTMDHCRASGRAGSLAVARASSSAGRRQDGALARLLRRGPDRGSGLQECREFRALSVEW